MRHSLAASILLLITQLPAQYVSYNGRAIQSIAATAATNRGYYLREPTGQGERIVFQFHGKLWSYDKGATIAVPITADNTEATSPAISPDGQAVAYVGTIGSDKEVFLTSLKTGDTRRLTYDGGFDVKVQGWLNNTEVLYSTTIKSKKRGPLLLAVSTETLAARQLPLAEASEGCVLGNDFIFAKNEELIDSNRQYQGGYAQRVYKIPMALLGEKVSAVNPAGTATILLSRDYEGISRNPVCLGQRIYFLSDRTGRFNIWSMNADGSGLIQHTFEKDFDIKSISACSETQLLFQKMGDIFVFDLKSKKIERVEISFPPNVVERNQQWSSDLIDATEHRISNDGQTVVSIVRGQLWMVDVSSKSARCIVCASGVRVKSPEISSDARSVIVLTDMSGEYDILQYDLVGDGDAKHISHDIKEPILDLSLAPDDAELLVRTISRNLYDVNLRRGTTQKIELATRSKPYDISWSKDNRYAAFVTYTPQDMGQIAVYDRQRKTTHYLTDGRYDVSSPVFSSDGSSMFYIAQLNFRSSINDTWAPSNYWPAYDNKALIYVHRLEAAFSQAGLDTDVDKADPLAVSLSPRQSSLLSRELPIVAGNYDALSLNSGRLYAYSKTAMRDNWGHLVALPIVLDGSRQAPHSVFPDAISKYYMSKDGSALLALGPQGLFVARTDATGQFGKPIPLNSVTGIEVKIDLVRERAQMFQELWRLYRDYFWDAGMAGVDWTAMRDKYIEFLPKVSNRAEFNELVSYMIAELGAGHTALGSPLARPQDFRSVGRLGGAFANDDGLRVLEVYDGDLDVMEERSPLSIAEPPVEVGDRIRRVNGFPVVSQSSLDRLLNGKVGAKVIVTIEKTDGKMVDVRISPISADHEAWLRLKSWSSANQKYVDQVSHSKVGYFHLSACYEADFSQLVRQYAYFYPRQALILDLRGNNGGNVDPWILHFFQRRTWLYVRDREDAMAVRHPRESFEGRLIVLVDGDTYSDGELIAEGVRQLGLGTLVGTRTSGAGMWVNDEKLLVDGGKVRIPQASSYVTEQGRARTVIEGRGVMPDVIVENDPYHFFFGRDAQLKSAVDIALKSPKNTKDARLR